MKDVTGQTTCYTYDLLGRMEQVTDEKGKVIGETSTLIYNTRNQLTKLHKALGITTFTYDQQGNILKESNPQGIICFQYNALNQQTKVIAHKGDILINHYDVEGLRGEIEENKKLTKFIFHNDEIAVETDEQFSTSFITSSTGKVENR